MPGTLLIGNATATFTHAGATALKIATAFQFEAKASGVVEELWFRTSSVENAGTTKLVLGIYAEGTEAPTGKPLGSGSLEESPLKASEWLKVAGLKIPVTKGTKYWLAALADGGTINYNTSVLTLGTPDAKSVTEHEVLEENTWGANLKTGPVGFQGLGTENKFAPLIVLDSFKRANEKPLSNSGKWSALFGFPSTGEVLEENWKNSVAETTVPYWNAREFKEPEISVKIAAPAGANANIIYLLACMSSPTTAEKSYYFLETNVTATGLSENNFKLYKTVKGTNTELAKKEKVKIEVGDSLGLQVSNGLVIAWHKTGAGVWEEIIAIADSTFTSGFVGMGGNATNARLSNFTVGATQTLSASLSFIGKVSRSISKSLSATLTFIGSLKRRILHRLRAIFYLPSFPANEILNPSFEYDVVGATPAWWKESTTGSPTEKTFRVSNGWSALGNNSLFIAATLNGSAGEQRMGLAAPTGLLAQARTQSKETWKVTAVINIIALPPFTQMVCELVFRDEQVHYLGSGGTSLNIFTTGEKVIELSGTAPAGSFECDLFPYARTNSTEANGKVEYYIDKISVSRKEQYTDGDQVGYRWAGTPGNSFTYSHSLFGQKMLHQLPASLTFLGKLLPIAQIIRKLEATLSFVGAIPKYVVHTTQATLSTTASLPRIIAYTLTASWTPLGTLRRYTMLTQTAALSFAGTLKSVTMRKISATITFVGSLPRSILHRVSSTLNPEGALNRGILHDLVGNLSFVGSIPSRITRPLAGTITFVGSIVSRTTIRVQSAALSFSGLIRSNVTKNLEAALSTAGTPRRNIVYALSAKLTFLGLIKFSGDFVHRIVASVNFSGVLPRSTRRTLAASASFSGSLGQSLVYRIRAALGTIGGLERAISHQLIGALTVSGKTPRIILQRLTASLGVISTLPKIISQRLRAMLEFAGFLESHLIVPPVHPVTPIFLRSIRGPDELTYHLNIPALTLQTPRIVPDELVRSELVSHITERSPSNFEKYVVSPKAHLRLANGQTKLSINSMLASVSSTLAKMRNQTVLVAYNQDHNPIEVSESYDG